LRRTRKAQSHKTSRKTKTREFEARFHQTVRTDRKRPFVGSKGGPGTDDPSLYRCTYRNVFLLIEDAYEILYYQLASGIGGRTPAIT
jgi:hypothetical protein